MTSNTLTQSTATVTGPKITVSGTVAPEAVSNLSPIFFASTHPTQKRLANAVARVLDDEIDERIEAEHITVPEDTLNEDFYERIFPSTDRLAFVQAFVGQQLSSFSTSPMLTESLEAGTPSDDPGTDIDLYDAFSIIYMAKELGANSLAEAVSGWSPC